MIIKVNNKLNDKNNNYRTKVRKIIRSGDLIAYSNNNFIGRIIRGWTGETFSHIGVAYIEDGRIYILEAQDGTGVCKRFLSEEEIFYLIKHNMDFTETEIRRAKLKIGDKYSYTDAILAGLGLGTVYSGSWQCAEYVSYIFDLNIKAPTPGNIIDHILDNHPFEVSCVTSCRG